jgi:hypothetical protein
MDAREFEIEKGALLRIDSGPGDRLHVRLGDVWVTQYGDSTDYSLRTGESMMLAGGVTLAMAYKRTQLAWYRSGPRPQAAARPLKALALVLRLFA